jgi:hypothetical protein
VALRRYVVVAFNSITQIQMFVSLDCVQIVMDLALACCLNLCGGSCTRSFFSLIFLWDLSGSTLSRFASTV